MNLTDAVQLHYEESGQGMPVVMLHGFPFEHTIWNAQRAALSNSYRVITPDLRGHGQSPYSTGTYTMDLLAGDVIALLDRLGIDRAVWVGHSMGGYITMAALRSAPERISGAAFVTTHPRADTPSRQLQRRESADVVMQQGPSTVAMSMLATLFASGVEGGSPMAQGIYDMMVKTSPEGVAGSLLGMADRMDSTDSLRNVTVPTIVIAGSEDGIIKQDMIQDLLAALPRADLVQIEGAGHLPMIERPDETTAALRRFLDHMPRS
jgi:pimeloyl-ACP methyl ester carboxylesterase